MKHKSCTEYWLDTQTLKFRGDFEAMYRHIADPWGCEAGHASLNNRLFLELLAEYSPYRRIVDLGCGLGGLTAMLAQRFQPAEVIGCDVSETAVSRARSLHPGIGFRCRDVREPLDDLGSADLVTLSEVLWYILDRLEIVFARLARLVRPGGALAIHQYFPAEQRFGRDVIDGLADFDRFVAERSALEPKGRITSHAADGVVLLAAYTTRSV